MLPTLYIIESYGNRRYFSLHLVNYPQPSVRIKPVTNYIIGLKTDSLFYYLFQTAPALLFELLGQPAQLATAYEFRSVELKQTAFRIDGVLLPHSSAKEQTVFFVEIQFQGDPYFYHRFFAEIFLFFRQNPQVIKWQAVVLFAKRSIEPTLTETFQMLLDSDRVNRIYLEDLQQIPSDSLGIALVQLIMAEANQAMNQAQTLITQAENKDTSLSTAVIIELIETIIVYKFPQLSREEIEKMLGLSEIKKTRVYQEALQEGRQEEGVNLILRLLARRVGSLPSEIEAQIRGLSLAEIEALGEALLDFSDISDLIVWLR